MILNECREEWERGLEVVGVFPRSTGGTCVILKSTHKRRTEVKKVVYYLHRYFAFEDDWQCSVDVNGGTCEQCVKTLSELK